jgi:hypothetical protein
MRGNFFIYEGYIFKKVRLILFIAGLFTLPILLAFFSFTKKIFNLREEIEKVNSQMITLDKEVVELTKDRDILAKYKGSDSLISESAMPYTSQTDFQKALEMHAEKFLLTSVKQGDSLVITVKPLPPQNGYSVMDISLNLTSFSDKILYDYLKDLEAVIGCKIKKYGLVASLNQTLKPNMQTYHAINTGEFPPLINLIYNLQCWYLLEPSND